MANSGAQCWQACKAKEKGEEEFGLNEQNEERFRDSMEKWIILVSRSCCLHTAFKLFVSTVIGRDHHILS